MRKITKNYKDAKCQTSTNRQMFQKFHYV